MKALLLLLLTAASLCSAHAMADSIPDKSLKFTLNLDSRQSFIKDRPVSIIGGKAGVQLKDKWRMGLGYYTLMLPLNIRYLDQGDTLSLKVKFQYVSLYLEYVLFHKKRWEISIPFQYGYAQAQFSKQSVDEHIVYKVKDQYMNLVEISLNGYFKIFNWVGIDGGLGYRAILETKDKAILKRFFDAPIYTIKLKIFVGELYHDVFKKKK